MYLSPEPVKILEDWFLSQLRIAFDQSVYVLIAYKEEEDSEAVPYDYVRIIYTGLSTNVLKDYSDQYFNFRRLYSSHTPSTLLPHRRSLAMLEKGRLALWEKLPPVPAQAYPLLLKSERLAKSSDCNCGPVYVQEWQAYNRLTNILIPNADPCMGAGEPGAIIPPPSGYITPLPQDPLIYYIAPNPTYDPEQPESNGFNQPYNWVNNGWVINPGYDPDLPTNWGNIPFILDKFVKSLQVVTTTKEGVKLHEQ